MSSHEYRTNLALRRYRLMSQPKRPQDCPCQRLRKRIELNILLDESVISAMSEALVGLRADDDPLVPEIEQAIRSHRIAILKQRVMLGALGIEV